MSESIKEITMRYFKHEYTCDECFYEDGIHYICVSTGETRPSYEYFNSKDHRHECPNCENGYWLEQIYPYIESRECEF